VTESLRQAWEAEAEAWTAWARAPRHDAFSHVTFPALRTLLPEPGERTLDLGAGEGRMGRALAAAGHRVLGLDSSPTLTRLAATHDQRVESVVADLAALPLRSGSADLAVACMSLQDVDDLDGAVRETARVLRPGGRLVLAIVHPINSAGRFAEAAPDAPFVIAGSYFDSFRYSDHVERGGYTMTFHSAHHSLERYSRALEAAGFVIEALREPQWLDAGDATRTEGWHRIPCFCLLRAMVPPDAPR
jgi:ubiquinone/menaquinone biosynthesis C-methylase UbiE